MEKKILMLGGAYSQIPAIKYAKEAGYYVITCDYLPDNPGHKYSDEYFNVSTTDKEEVLKLAKKLNIDGIVAYASDPSAPTAAFVSDALNLTGASYNSVKILAEKDLFRDFLKQNGFNYPKFYRLDSIDAIHKLNDINYPVYVKPVDSSGSKGITRVDSPKHIKKSVSYAFEFTRCNRVIVEEYISTPFNQLHGDGFAFNNELVFLGLCDHHFKNAAPISSTFPTRVDKNKIELVHKEVNKVIKKSGFKSGAINVEVRITEDDKIYIMEIGPRSGGNYVPQLMECGAGFNEVSAIVENAMGNIPDIKIQDTYNHCLQYIIGTDESGKFDDIVFSDEFNDKVINLYRHKEKGDSIESYNNSSNVVGVVIAKCHDESDLYNTIKEIKNHVKVVLK